MFNLKDFIEEQTESSTDWEIDLSPLLALMVTLIPVLLLQTSFVTLRMLETTLPVVSNNVEDENKKDEQEVSLDIYANKDKSIELKAKYGKEVVLRKRLASRGKDFDISELKAQMYAFKKKYPNHYSAKLTPDDNIEYQNLILVLDAIRKIDQDKALKFEDENGKKIETVMLFPDVIFGNVND